MMTTGAARLASTVLAVAAIPLLHRMRSDLDRNGALRWGTQLTMWTAYATFESCSLSPSPAATATCRPASASPATPSLRPGRLSQGPA